MRRSNLIILLVALAMGGIAALMARSWIAQHTTAQPVASTSTILVAAAPLAFGTVLTEDNVSEIPWAEPQLPEGAFAKKIDLLREGRRVVLTALERSETQKGETENSADVLIEYVKVLAIDQLVNERQDQPAVATVAKAVTLQVSPEQAQKLLLAGNVGKLSLVLRQPAEGKLGEGRRITDSDLGPGFARREAKASPVSLPILQALKLDTVK